MCGRGVQLVIVLMCLYAYMCCIDFFLFLLLIILRIPIPLLSNKLRSKTFLIFLLICLSAFTYIETVLSSYLYSSYIFLCPYNSYNSLFLLSFSFTIFPYPFASYPEFPLPIL